MCQNIARLKTETENKKTFLVIRDPNYKPDSMFPRIIGNSSVNECPIVKDLLVHLMFRADPNPTEATSAGIKINDQHVLAFNLQYKGPMNVSNYDIYFSAQNGDNVIASMRQCKHFAFASALLLSAEHGWQAMPHETGNLPCANSMKINYHLRNSPGDAPNLIVNDNRTHSPVHPQHGLAHATKYGMSVHAVYGNNIPKSIAQLNIYDFLINWRRLYVPRNYKLHLVNNQVIPQPANDALVTALNETTQAGNTQIYRRSIITFYLIVHALYGGFQARDSCYRQLMGSIDTHPILMMHAFYKAVLDQGRICTFPMWLLLPFRPLFIIMIQIYRMKKNKKPVSWKDLLDVKENQQIFTNVFEKEYSIKFDGKGGIKKYHNYILCVKAKKCEDPQKVYNDWHFDNYMKSVFEFAYNYTCSKDAFAHIPNANQNNVSQINVISNVLSYALNSVIINSEGPLADNSRIKHYAYVDPAKYNRDVNQWKSVLTHTINAQGYIDDVIRTELHYLIDNLPDPSANICNNRQ